MCLIAVAWKVHPRFPLALIANRDEAHARPTAAAGFDARHPDVYGGRDLAQGGGWLMASTRGRLAAVTNVRTGLRPPEAQRSRGALVRTFAGGEVAAMPWLASLMPTAPTYGPFNLLAWDGEALGFASNHPAPGFAVVAPRTHAMSNGAFDATWPKSTLATRALDAWLASSLAEGAVDRAAIAPLLDALADTAVAPDAALPDTGIGLALERALSPPFVVGRDYGTRCSTVVLVEDSAITFVERRFGPEGVVLGESYERLPRP